MNRKILKRDRFDLVVKKYSNFFKISRTYYIITAFDNIPILYD